MTASAKTPARPKRRGGRPTKLSATLQTKICELVASGVPSEDAAVAVGISRRTFFKWLERGAAGEPLYEDFQLAIDEAFATFHVATVGQAVSDPKNAMTILQTRFGKQWGRTDKHQIDVSVSHRPMIDPTKGPIERLQLLRELLAEFSADQSELPKDGVPASELMASIDGVVLREEDA